MNRFIYFTMFFWFHQSFGETSGAISVAMKKCWETG